jgi:hypothetical protein
MGDLIERLREKHENEVIYRQEYHLEVCAEAADAIEAKDAEIARLRSLALHAIDTIALVQEYRHSGDPWEENAMEMREHEVYDFDVAAARAALGD